MGKVIEFIREKIFFIAIALIVVLAIVVVIGLLSKGELADYKNTEKKMVAAAKEYYSERENRLPKTVGEMVSVTLSVLVDGKYIDEVKDPKDDKTICTGKVETIKTSDDYLYEAYLNCGDNYINKTLADELILKLEQDENGNGLHQYGNEYIYKGDNLKNYLKFNSELWRIIKIDSDKAIKVIKVKRLDAYYVWDDRYNIETETEEGINDFSISRIRNVLNEYYETDLDAKAKSKIVKKAFCIGKRGETGSFDGNLECADKIELNIGLINASEYYQASLDPNCKNFGEEQCNNYNYFSDNYISTWTLTGSSEYSNKVFFVNGEINLAKANRQQRISPVVHLSSSTVYTGGIGTEEKPYIIK